MEDMRKQANDLLCYYNKMQNRLSQSGVTDTGSLVTMFNQLQRGLDSVAFEELDPAIQEVNRLMESLGKMQADLQVLRELKTRVTKMRATIDGSGSTEGPTASGGAGRRAA
jgi:hypothetical protein